LLIKKDVKFPVSTTGTNIEIISFLIQSSKCWERLKTQKKTTPQWCA